MTLPHRLTRRAAALLLAAAPLAAATAPAAAEAPILTVSGNVEGGTRSFTRAELAALPHEVYETSTVWTEGVRRFGGVPLHALMDALGAEGGTLRLTAINDYAVEIPMADAVPGAALLAYELDGQPMSVRQKGPVWLVYPYDSDGKWRTESVYARSVWQLNRIEVRD